MSIQIVNFNLKDMSHSEFEALCDELAQTYLEHAADDATREALQAGSVVRRLTEPLLKAMLLGAAPRDAIDRLRSLPFVESGSEGLIIHDAVREAVETSLRVSNPELHRRYRMAAWPILRGESRDAGREHVWRTTADLLYMLENPVIREGFFPSGAQQLSMEPREPEGDSAIRTIIEQHEGAESVRARGAWLTYMPHAFHVARDREGSVSGFYAFELVSKADRRVAEFDPVTAAWFEHLSAESGPPVSLFVRRWLLGWT